MGPYLVTQNIHFAPLKAPATCLLGLIDLKIFYLGLIDSHQW